MVDDDCVVSRTVIHCFTCDLVTCVLKWCKKIMNVGFVLKWPYAVDGMLKSKYCLILFVIEGVKRSCVVVFPRALVGAGVSQARSQTLHFRLPFFERFRNSEDRYLHLVETARFVWQKWEWSLLFTTICVQPVATMELPCFFTCTGFFYFFISFYLDLKYPPPPHTLILCFEN